MRSVVFVGQAYYNAYFLNLDLRSKGNDTLLINIDPNHEQNSKYYWGEDKILPQDICDRLELFFSCINRYQIFHFANRGGIYFLNYNSAEGSGLVFRFKRYFFYFLLFILKHVSKVKPSFLISSFKTIGIIQVDGMNVKLNVSKTKIKSFMYFFVKGLPLNWDIFLLKALGKKIIYTNNGCHDGVTPASFSKWGPSNVCSICAWNSTSVCTNEDARKWGAYRNAVADVQILSGSNRADYNLVKTAREIPEYYCLDKNLWRPGLEIPEKYKLNFPDDVIKIYHSVGNYNKRTNNGVNIKCSHIYFPLIEELKKEGYKVELVFCEGIPNRDVRFVMAQCDLVVDMLTFGWFGANIREAMMLGIPSVCFIRPEWLEDVRQEIPEYANDLPVVNANPENIKQILIQLISDKSFRRDIGNKSRDFAVKWHSIEAGTSRMEKLYSELLNVQ